VVNFFHVKTRKKQGRNVDRVVFTTGDMFPPMPTDADGY